MSTDKLVDRFQAACLTGLICFDSVGSALFHDGLIDLDSVFSEGLSSRDLHDGLIPNLHGIGFVQQEPDPTRIDKFGPLSMVR